MLTASYTSEIFPDIPYIRCVLLTNLLQFLYKFLNLLYFIIDISAPLSIKQLKVSFLYDASNSKNVPFMGN